MSAANLIARGIGFNPGSVKYIITSGLLAGAPVVVIDTPNPGGGSYRPARFSRSWSPDHTDRPLTRKEEKELVQLVKRAIDEDDLKARKHLEALAVQYRDFENSLASFSEAFQSMTELNRKRFENQRITALKYMAEQRDIEEEEQIILHLLRYMS